MRLLTERAVAGSTPGNDPGQVVCAHVPLSPSSIIWYRRKLGSKRQVLRHTGPVSRILGFVHCRLKGLEKEMSASPRVYMTRVVLYIYNGTCRFLLLIK